MLYFNVVEEESAVEFDVDVVEVLNVVDVDVDVDVIGVLCVFDVSDFKSLLTLSLIVIYK